MAMAAASRIFEMEASFLKHNLPSFSQTRASGRFHPPGNICLATFRPQTHKDQQPFSLAVAFQIQSGNADARPEKR